MAIQDPDRVATHVANRRGELGLTQAQLAERARVDAATISSLERSEHWPRAGNRAKIEDALGWQRGSLATIRSGGTAALADQAAEDRPRYLDPAEQHIADTPGLTREEVEALIAVARSIRGVNARRTGTG